MVDPMLQRLIALLLVLAGIVGQGAGLAIGGNRADTAPISDAVVSPQRELPSGLTPSLANATKDVPASYEDGCHAKAGETRARTCAYGDRTSKTRVLLFGDSHAASWLPALDALGKREGWKILSLTKSACPIPKVTVTVRGKTPSDCDVWRKNAIDRIGEIHPELVVATSFDHVYTIAGKTGSAFKTAWQEGLRKTLVSLRSRADKVIILGDSPLWKREAPDCLRDHRDDIGRCATRRADAVFPGRIALSRHAAQDAGVSFADTTAITCLADPCPVVSGKYLLLRDDSHMTATWSRHLASDLLGLLAKVRP
jgi:SGNH domain (fused to AT3 domains)